MFTGIVQSQAEVFSVNNRNNLSEIIFSETAKNSLSFVLKNITDSINKNGFENCKYRDLSGGIVSIHSGWKV